VSREIKDELPRCNLPLEELLEQENERFGINHREIGSHLMKRWNFPEHFVILQKYHRNILSKNGDNLFPKIIELARMTTEAVFIKQENLYKVKKFAKEIMKIEHSQMDEIISSVFEKVNEMADQLRIHFDESDMIDIMEKANRSLARINAMMEESISKALTVSVESKVDKRTEDSDLIMTTLDAVAHEIRNPLTAIGGFAKRLAEFVHLHEKGRRYASIIEKESMRLEMVLKEIVEYCREYRPMFEKVEFCSLISSIIDQQKDELKEKGINLILDLPEKEINITLDPCGIRRIIHEIIKNVIKRSNGKAGIFVKINILELKDKNEVVLRISDNSSAFRDDEIRMLMEFDFTSKTLAGKLGFQLIQRIVGLHGGKIKVISSDDNLNIIDIFLPMK